MTDPDAHVALFLRLLMLALLPPIAYSGGWLAVLAFVGIVYCAWSAARIAAWRPPKDDQSWWTVDQ